MKIAVAEGKVRFVADNKLLTRILLSWYGTKSTSCKVTLVLTNIDILTITAAADNVMDAVFPSATF